MFLLNMLPPRIVDDVSIAIIDHMIPAGSIAFFLLQFPFGFSYQLAILIVFKAQCRLRIASPWLCPLFAEKDAIAIETGFTAITVVADFFDDPSGKTVFLIIKVLAFIMDSRFFRIYKPFPFAR